MSPSRIRQIDDDDGSNDEPHHGASPRRPPPDLDCHVLKIEYRIIKLPRRGGETLEIGQDRGLLSEPILAAGDGDDDLNPA